MEKVDPVGLQSIISQLERELRSLTSDLLEERELTKNLTYQIENAKKATEIKLHTEWSGDYEI